MADRHAGVNPHVLHGEHFERPKAAEADVAEAGRDVYEQAQPADRRAPLDHRHQVVRLGPLSGAAQVKLAGVEHQAVGGQLQPPHAVGLLHIEHQLLVRQ